MRPLVILTGGAGSGQTTVAEERGCSAESVINQYRRADLIIPEGGENKLALEVLCAYVAQARRRLSASIHESVSS